MENGVEHYTIEISHRRKKPNTKNTLLDPSQRLDEFKTWTK